jgi:hypothetical protein
MHAYVTRSCGVFVRFRAPSSGEDPKRFQKKINGDSRNSAIKQVASGDLGVY